MDEKYWKQFETSGRIEDYLKFTAMRNEAGHCQIAAENNEAMDVHCDVVKAVGETGQSCRNIFI